MTAFDTRIDAYIGNAAPFAQPVLHHLRDLIHKYCPGIEEALKWNCPYFLYKGRNAFHMAAFKHHCAFGFSLASIMTDPDNLLEIEDKHAMGSLGKITAIKDLPSEEKLAPYFKQTIRLVEDGVKVPRQVKRAEAPIAELPGDFMTALRKNKKALAVFEDFSPSHRKEYLEWVTEAKKEQTRARRIAQAIEMMTEGKSRHWKYSR